MIDQSEANLSADERTAVIDALLRFASGTDDGDAAAIRSAFAYNAVVDFSACGASIGLDFEPLEGANAVVNFLAGTSARQATSHVVANARVRSTAGGAHLRALVDATHVVRADTGHRFRMMNWYDADLVASDGRWRISRLVIANIWFEGDAAVLFVR